MGMTLDELTALDITSVTNTDSLFFYAVHSGADYRVSGRTLSDVMGMPSQFATMYRTTSVDIVAGTPTIVSWTATYSDTYGFVDGSSATLFRVMDDKIKSVQLMCNMQWEPSQFGFREVLITAGGMPFTPLVVGDNENWTEGVGINLDCSQQTMSPRWEVQSGSYFYVTVEHEHSVNRMILDSGASAAAREVFFSIWGWEGA